MRAVIQRVHNAKCVVESKITGEIQQGLLVFLGVGEDDTEDDLQWLVKKVPNIRCFTDDNGQMNLSLKDVDGDILVISQFTLFGNLKKGSRPSFNRAAQAEKAKQLYELFVEKLSLETNKNIPTGIFAAHMDIEANNDGPITLIIDSKEKRF